MKKQMKINIGGKTATLDFATENLISLTSYKDNLDIDNHVSVIIYKGLLGHMEYTVDVLVDKNKSMFKDNIVGQSDNRNIAITIAIEALKLQFKHQLKLIENGQKNNKTVA